MPEEKKNKPFVAKLFAGIFKTLALLIVLAVIAVVGAGIFVKVKYDVNVLALIGEMKSLSQNSGKDSVVTNEFSDEDLASYAAKELTVIASPLTKFTDKEVGAKLANLVEVNSEISLTFGNNDMDYLGAKIVQVLFKNIAEQPSDNLCDINVVLHLNMRKYKGDNFSKFPQSIFKNLIPDDIYVSCTSTVIKDETDGYKITKNVLTINALNSEDTENVLKVINMFNSNFGTANELADSLGKSTVGAIIGENSIVGELKEIGARDYGFGKTSTDNNLVVYVVDTDVTKTITYNNLNGADNSLNPATYNITYLTINLKDVERVGYTFDGWYTDSSFASQVTTLNAELMQDFVVYAKWTAINYTITLDLNGGTYSGETEINYTIESANITLPQPTKTIGGETYPFNGWLGTGVEEINDLVIIETGSYGDKSFKAYYIGDTAVVSVYVDNVFEKTVLVNCGEKLDEDFLDFAEIGMSGYSVDTWYTNSAQTTAFDFDEGLDGNVTLYGTSEFVVKLLLFPKYFEKFEAAKGSGNLTVNSRDELRAYVDYVLFYQVTNDVTITLNYVFSDNSTEIQSAINYVIGKNELREGFSYSHSAHPIFNNRVTITCSHSSFLDSPILVADSIKSFTYTQQDYGLKLDVESARTAESTFKIDDIVLSIPVTTSAQLVFALESGVRPICAPGSAAEDIYNKAKAVLRQICDDTMDDVTKLKAIYEWIILNTVYDKFAADACMDANVAKMYDSWAAEGVFNSGKAVCEGYAKAFIIMAKIEGIPAIFVTGNGHAWNRVYVDGAWYVVDATHGNPLNEALEIETTTYGEFMITDAQKTYKGYTSDDYTYLSATTNYNYYQDYQDLTIDSMNELKVVFIAAKNSADLIDSTYITVDVYVLAANVSSFNGWLNTAKTQAGVQLYSSGYLYSPTASGDYIYTILIKK